MITIIKISGDKVTWSEGEGEPYVYPRSMFPENLTLDSEIEYCVGEFHSVKTK